jgi:excisionase family DNA binding protein
MALRERKRLSEQKPLEIDATMTGTLSFKDRVNLQINGRFEGRLDFKGTLTIGKNAEVKAEIKGDNIIVAGKLKGDIKASERVVVLSSAVLEGNISTPRLSIEEGAIFEGNSQMVAKTLNAEELAHYLEVDTSSILEWANSGKIPAYKEGNECRFELKKIDEWVSQGKLK